MDTAALTTPEVAKLLGVSLPAAHHALDAYGIPRPGRGRPRTTSKNLVDEIIAQRGRTPRSAYRPTEVRVLAALSRSPLGLSSTRSVAAKAGVSPTTASKALEQLGRQGFAEQREVVTASGRAERQKRWFISAAHLPAELMHAVRGTRLPERPDPRGSLPRELYHLFWNADISRLDPAKDGSYLADRLLSSPDLRAWRWAITNLSRSDIERALRRRGASESTRALVRNWWSHGH
jgi:hypothetical protein